MKNHTFSILLIKDSVRKTKDIIKNYQSLKQFNIKISGLSNTALFIKKLPSRPPKWLSLFEDMISADEIRSLKSSLVSGIFLVDRGGKKYALAFGYGRALLDPGCYEERFGLIVTLNSIDSNSIRSIDKKTFETPIYKHTRDQAGRPGSASDFGLNVDQDLVRSITGKPTEEDLGNRLSGADSLSVTIKASLYELPALLDKFHEKFKDTSYRNNFPWADHFSQVTHKPVIEILNQSLIDKIRAKEMDRMWMALPEIVEWSSISGFRYSPSILHASLPNIDMESFLSIRGADDMDIQWLKRKKVYAFNVDDTAAHAAWRAYNCIYCEIDKNGNTYILNGGIWYCLASSYVDEINTRLYRIRYSRIDLPPCSELSEGEYNIRVQRENKDSVALMDKKLVLHGGGKSKIEFCDLYTKDKQLIHIKKYGASSTLSHLVYQGRVAGQLFHMDPEFREKVNHLLPKSFRLANPKEAIQTKDYEIIYAVISKEAGEQMTLPFFSRVSLVLAARELRGYGYKVSLKKIGVV